MAKKPTPNQNQFAIAERLLDVSEALSRAHDIPAPIWVAALSVRIADIGFDSGFDAKKIGDSFVAAIEMAAERRSRTPG